MSPGTDFVSQVADAYEHLYDLVYLRTQPLLDALAPSPLHAAAESPKKRARQLHQRLLEAVTELDPGPQAPAFSNEWRRHRLMVLRYVKGLPAQAVADELGISLRHYYRVQEGAIADIANILAERYAAQESAPSDAAPQKAVPSPGEEPSAGETAPSAAGPDVAASDTPSRLALLRLEAARMAQSDRSASLGDVLAGALSVLREMVRQHRLVVRTQLPAGMPPIPVGASLLRQQLLALLGYLVERAQDATLRLSAEACGPVVFFTARIDPPGALRTQTDTDQLAGLEEMARLDGAQLQPLMAGDAIVGFEVRFPVAEHKVLVVDDNEDILELFERYLTPHHYRVATARTAPEALARLAESCPSVIILDLMMPQQDGWDLLQILLNRPDTHRLPIVVCSVLKQRELALSLGATVFLEKPLTEAALLSVLETLVEP